MIRGSARFRALPFAAPWPWGAVFSLKVTTMHHRDSLRCACAQIEHTPDSPDTLFGKHIAFLEQAQDEQIDIVTFPETSLTGYPPNREAVRKMAIWADDPRLTSLAQKARNGYAEVGFI